jgi:hypothetical protein
MGSSRCSVNRRMTDGGVRPWNSARGDRNECLTDRTILAVNGLAAFRRHPEMAVICSASSGTSAGRAPRPTLDQRLNGAFPAARVALDARGRSGNPSPLATFVEAHKSSSAAP